MAENVSRLYTNILPIFQTINVIIFACQQYKASQLELNVTAPAKDWEQKMEKRH